MTSNTLVLRWRALLVTACFLPVSLTGCPDGAGSNPTGDAGVSAETTFDSGGNQDGTTGPDEGTPDSGTPDGGTPDTQVDPDIPVVEGAFGWPCQTNGDCDSGWCVESGDGYVCTKTCDLNCPNGWDCKSVNSGSDLVFLCQPRFQKLCVPCTEDLQCNGGRCLQIDGESQCTFSCDIEQADACPGGFTCETDSDAGGDFCKPNSGSCTCTEDTAGAQRGCELTNGIGTCTGFETCDPTAGWTGCTAFEPADEDCDGADNDCDGLIDEDLPTDQACTNEVAGVGSCQGVDVCMGINGWVCQGPQPSEETCDFQDNDCDGEIDEDFKAGDVYQSFEHCGTCNYSCGLGFPNAASTECLVFGQTPQCVVDECEEGFVKANDFQCLPDAASICQPCATDANCLGTDSACVQLAEGTYCSQSCSSVADCPAGYDCAAVAGVATTQCVPSSGSCSCDGTNLELQRSCSETFTPPAPQPEYTCSGFEQCTATGWGGCTLPTEECDAVDNNCDGQVDEGFVNGDGVYDKVEHCGGCGISCLALGFENASPSCDISGAVPQCTFTCNTPYQDVDGNPTNGCECLPQAGDDLVGDGLDTNCDGIDGEVGNGIFVAKNGDDANPGTIDEPKLTIAAGLAAASSGNKRDVYVATGVYSENIVLIDGKGLFGGYSPDFRDRDPITQETAILGDVPTGNQAGTITAAGLGNSGNAKTIVDGFTIFGYNAANQAGENSYALYLSECGSNVEVTNNRIIGGPGGNGGQGGGGSDGNDGQDGAGGDDVYDTGTDQCVASMELPGGTGGTNTCTDGTALHGGDGGESKCPVWGAAPASSEYGSDGVGAGAGTGGEPGWDSKIPSTPPSPSCGLCTVDSDNIAEGAPGTDGSEGSDGLAGNGCNAAQGTVAGGQWIGGAGSDGIDGTHGRGGGGGGSGRGNDLTGCSNPHIGDDVGGSGGGAGSGGCNGTGGDAGDAGGGSFGVFIVYSNNTTAVPIVADNTIRRGSGGAGGTGGPGGAGGVAGFGGLGGAHGTGSAIFCSAGGGEGGDGGRGGHGAGGGGGCGGASYGIFAWNASGSAIQAYNAANAYQTGGSGGTGGLGGPSLGNSGGAGLNGVSADTNF